MSSLGVQGVPQILLDQYLVTLTYIDHKIGRFQTNQKHRIIIPLLQIQQPIYGREMAESTSFNINVDTDATPELIAWIVPALLCAFAYALYNIFIKQSSVLQRLEILFSKPDNTALEQRTTSFLSIAKKSL